MIIETERLILRQIEISDSEKLLNIMNKETMYAWEHGFSENDVNEHIEKNQKKYLDYGIGFYTVILKDTDEIIGQIGLMKMEKDKYDGGWIIGNKYWRNGYAFEGVKAFFEYGFNELNLDVIYAEIKHKNEASVRLAKKLGMKIIGETVKNYRGKEMPHTVFSVSKKDFYSTT